MNAQLNQAILTGGIRSTNFFNGRLLSGEDMTTEQAAILERACRLGQAVGSGVAWGLEVQMKTTSINGSPPTSASPVLTVSAGLAINRCGQPVKLTNAVDVTLVRQSAAAGVTTRAKTFDTCRPPTTGGRLTGDGVYLFTVAPAQAQEGRAPVNGLSADSTRCNSQHLVEGTQFNLIRISDPYVTSDDFAPANLPYLRNRIAYRCFGAAPVAATLQDPFSTYLQEYGVVDGLRSSGTLSPAEVPLALLHWTSSNGIEFVDLWAVRRRITRASTPSGFFPFLPDRRTTETEAMFLQFQQQVSDILANETNWTAIRATDRFEFLPPVGLLPLGGTGTSQGFDVVGFFSGLSCRKPLYIEGAKLRKLVHDALSFPPIDLSSQELIWQYLVRENIEAIDKAKANPPQPCLVLANGQISFRADARFDLSRWNYSNFA
jgi:hypothetical protein